MQVRLITDERGGIINDPVLLRLGENHFWLSLADSDVLLWAKGVAYNAGMHVTITEPDVGPLQIQGPKSKEVMTDLFGGDILELPYYHLVERELEGMRMVISRTGYSGELWPAKGSLRPGADADIILVDPREQWKVKDREILSRAGWSPFAGRTMIGRPVRTYLRGRLAFADGQVIAEPGAGRAVERQAHRAGKGTETT